MLLHRYALEIRFEGDSAHVFIRPKSGGEGFHKHKIKERQGITMHRSLFTLFVALSFVACGGSVSMDEPTPDAYVEIDENNTGGSLADSIPETMGEAGSSSVDVINVNEDPVGEAGNPSIPRNTPEQTGGMSSTGGTTSVDPIDDASEGGSSPVIATGGSATTSTGGSIIAQAGASSDVEAGGSAGTFVVENNGEGGSAGSNPGIIGNGGAAGSVGSDGGAAGSTSILTVSAALSPYGHDDGPQPRIVPTTVRSPAVYGWYLFTNSGDEDLVVNSVTVREINSNGKITDFEEVILGDTGGAYGGCSIRPETAGQDVEFSSASSCWHGEEWIVVPAHGELVFPLSYRIAEVVPSSEAGPDSPRSGDSPQLEIVEVTANDGTVQAVVEPQNHPIFVLRRSAPSISWEEITEPLHDGLNTIARLTIHGVHNGVQQALFNIEGSEGLSLESPEEGTFFIGGEATSFGCFHVSGASALGVYMDPVEDIYINASYPLTIEIRANVSGVQSGSSIRTRLALYDADTENRTVQILGSGSPGVLLAGPHLPDPPFTAGLFWSDFSEGDDHVAYRRGDAQLGTTSVVSSLDYATAYLVPGADGSSTVTAP